MNLLVRGRSFERASPPLSGRSTPQTHHSPSRDYLHKYHTVSASSTSYNIYIPCHDLFGVGFYFYPCFSFFSQFQWWKVIVLLSQAESSSVFLIRVWELPSEFFNKNLCVWSQWLSYWYQNLQVSLTCFLLIIFVDIKWKFCIFYNYIIFNLCVIQLFYFNL